MGRRGSSGGFRADRAYWLARLGRERPDLRERVRRRELSAFAAAVEAGWRRLPKPGSPPRVEPSGAGRPRWAYFVQRGNIDPDGRNGRPPGLFLLPILAWTVSGLPIVGPERLGDPERVNWMEEGLPLTLLKPQSDGVGFYNDEDFLGYACPPIEADREFIREESKGCIDGEIGWRLRRELGCDGRHRILLDEAEARALFADYRRRWSAAAPARERFVAEFEADAARWRDEQERLRRGRSSGRGAGDRGGGTGPPDPLREAAVELGLAWPCSAEAVREAHRRLTRGNHPDRHGPGATDRMARINAARDVLLRAPDEGPSRA